MFNIDYLPYDIILNSKPISYEFTDFKISSEEFIVYILNCVTVLVMTLGFFIFILSALECCWPSSKSKKCQWIIKYMRICVEYITFNIFLRWFHEFCLTLFISCFFNLRIDPKNPWHWSSTVSYVLCILFLIFTALYLAWIVYYFRRSWRPTTLDLPVQAVKRRPDNDFSNMAETIDNFGKNKTTVSGIDKTSFTDANMYQD